MLFFQFIHNTFRGKILTCLLLVICADFLFFEQPVGWTYGAFSLLMIAAIVFHNFAYMQSSLAKILILLVVGQALALVEKPNDLAFILTVTGLISLSIMRYKGWHKNAFLWLRMCGRFFAGYWAVGHFIRAFIRARRQRVSHISAGRILRRWLLPVIFSILFLILLSQANPIIMGWFALLDFAFIFDFITFSRIVFWIIMAWTIFRIIRPKILFDRHVVKPISDKEPIKAEGGLKAYFSKESILRSLIIFNVIFAFQTLLDITYLWQGKALPDGISYAQYAHKGAYPLILTALLAGAFVLMIQWAGTEVSGSQKIKRLVYFWIAQNILLVFSSIFRTHLYVEIYTLTYLRVAAFIWMGLVACGLISLILRILWDKSGLWLINCNALMLLVVLYVTSFVNLGGIIAQYNVVHAKEFSGTGRYLDFGYLEEIGVESIPALEIFIQTGNAGTADRKRAGKLLLKLKAELTENTQTWRHWTFRDYRLLKYSEGGVNP